MICFISDFDTVDDSKTKSQFQSRILLYVPRVMLILKQFAMFYYIVPLLKYVGELWEFQDWNKKDLFMAGLLCM